jgi:hypothetical protein
MRILNNIVMCMDEMFVQSVSGEIMLKITSDLGTVFTNRDHLKPILITLYTTAGANRIPWI